ncbi:UDP-2,4-diacetamido-2,4,6-trideoxy-beta-L-altropyranose hydrolase [Variovorax sp. YR752]|uniref:UDP-2,4-diacetamido-2,4, 6-trideoxy-beta-L-altropyranose hydrolase n=1 Tax=Variovorax sp. YR752 TaxID=1884383 RepID=UPI0031377C22
MDVLIRADACAALGLGHLKRCLSLAQALRAQGAAVTLAWRRIDLDCSPMIEAAGVNSLCIGNGPVTGELFDARDLLSATNGASLIVADHYALGERWHRAVRANTNARLAAIDDLADRPLAVDIAIDPNFSTDPAAKFAGRLPENARLLAGPQHALLGPGYADAPRCPQREPVRSVGIFMGGTDAAGLSAVALDALEQIGFPGTIEIATTQGNPHLDALRTRATSRPRLAITLDQPDLADFFARHDLQIGAGGGATWERCCIGAPTLAAIAADNQRPVLLPLQQMGVLRVLADEPPTAAAIATGVRELIENPALRRSLAERAKALVDGRGAQRVATALLSSAAPSTP